MIEPFQMSLSVTLAKVPLAAAQFRRKIESGAMSQEHPLDTSTFGAEAIEAAIKLAIELPPPAAD